MPVGSEYLPTSMRPTILFERRSTTFTNWPTAESWIFPLGSTTGVLRRGDAVARADLLPAVGVRHIGEPAVWAHGDHGWSVEAD